MYIIVGLIFSILTLMLRAFVLTKLWLWFVVTQFAWLPPLSHGSAMGISLFVSILMAWHSLRLHDIKEMRVSKPEETLDVVITNGLVQITVILMAWGFGWVIHSFM